MGGFAFDPLLVMNFLSPGTWHYKFVLSIAFPAAVYLAYLPQARQRLDLNLAWLTFGVGAAYLYLLSEPRDWTSANFLWGAEMAMLDFDGVSMLFFIQMNLERAKWDRRTYLCAALLALHIICGIVWYAAQYNPIWYDAWW